MPKVEQIDWSKLKPALPAKKSTHDGNSSLARNLTGIKAGMAINRKKTAKPAK